MSDRIDFEIENDGMMAEIAMVKEGIVLVGECVGGSQGC